LRHPCLALGGSGETVQVVHHLRIAPSCLPTVRACSLPLAPDCVLPCQILPASQVWLCSHYRPLCSLIETSVSSIVLLLVAILPQVSSCRGYTWVPEAAACVPASAHCSARPGVQAAHRRAARRPAVPVCWLVTVPAAPRCTSQTGGSIMRSRLKTNIGGVVAAGISRCRERRDPAPLLAKALISPPPSKLVSDVTRQQFGYPQKRHGSLAVVPPRAVSGCSPSVRAAGSAAVDAVPVAGSRCRGGAAADC
jgi:hypothetical protein